MNDRDLIDSEAAARAAMAWRDGHGIRGALLAYGLTLEGVGAWGEVGLRRLHALGTREPRFDGAYVGAIGAALVLGIELGRMERAA